MTGYIIGTMIGVVAGYFIAALFMIGNPSGNDQSPQ